MDFCVECGELKGKNKELFVSALCGQLRCENHLIWVPSHLINHSHLKIAAEIKERIKHRELHGWYTFCGRPGHIPRGMSYWYGEDRQNGKIVERIGDHQKMDSFEFYQFWQVGIIENGIEKRWESSHFEPSCDFSLSLRLIHRFANERDERDLAKRLWDKVISLVTEKKKTYYPATEKEFLTMINKESVLLSVAQYLCSRCISSLCLNRLVPFYDRKSQTKHLMDS